MYPEQSQPWGRQGTSAAGPLACEVLAWAELGCGDSVCGHTSRPRCTSECSSANALCSSWMEFCRRLEPHRVKHHAFSILGIREGHFLQVAKPGTADAVWPLIHSFAFHDFGRLLSNAAWKHSMKNYRNN